MNHAHRGVELTLEQQARRAFERSVAELDGTTRAKLMRARMTALESHEEVGPRALVGRPASWVVAGAVAAVALSFAWLLQSGAPSQQRAVQLASSPDVDLLLGNEELDMLKDLDFYSWLDQQARRDSPKSGNDGIG